MEINFKNNVMKKAMYFILIVTISYTSRAQSVPSYVSTDSLLTWYPFNGNANNAYGNWGNGVITGATLTTDRFGTANSAYHFNGCGDHIDIDTAFFNVGWSNYSISCWLNSETLTNTCAYENDQLYFNTVPHRALDLSFNYSFDNKYTFFVNSNAAASAGWDILFQVTSRENISIQTWNHVVFAKENDTAYQFYLNGALDTTFTASLGVLNYYCKLIFGRIDTVQTNQGFIGTLDDYGIWNRTLAACEVRRLYNSSPFSYITSQPADTFTALGSTVHFSIMDTGIGNTFQWQINNGSGYTNLSNTAPYSGVTTASLTVTGVTNAMNNNKFRCVVSGMQVCVDTSVAGVLTINTSGVVNINNSSSIGLAPNPSSGDIYVSGTDKVNINVYNGIGQLVKEVPMAEKISIRDLPDGMYVVKLFNEQGNIVYSGKILKHE